MPEKPDLPIKSFKAPDVFRAWLLKHHAKAPGIWLRFFKKASGKKTISYDEALDQALCFGWIDGQVQRCDEDSYLQRFTPRRPRSPWSKRNTEHVARLHAAGLVMPAGIAAIEAARADGRWNAAYASPKNAAPPDDFLIALAKRKKAQAFFNTLSRANLYAIIYRLTTCKKPETRTRRMQQILDFSHHGIGSKWLLQKMHSFA